MGIIANGVGGIDKLVSGKIIEWSDDFLETPALVKNNIVYNAGDMPLYRAAFLVDNGASAVLIEEGGKNYHPLILFNDAGVAAVAGVGRVDLKGEITVDSGKGIIYKGEIKSRKTIRKFETPKTKTRVYVNVGYPTSIESAAKTGADGIGLLRTEFIAVRTLSKILNKELFDGVTVKDAIMKSNEADVIYTISKHKDLREYLKLDIKNTIKDAMNYFGKKEIIIRTFDIARELNEPMGNRGIRRCIAEGGDAIKILAEAIKESLEENRGNYNIGIILPLVSHYSQIKTALDIFLAAGLRLIRNSENVAERFHRSDICRRDKVSPPHFRASIFQRKIELKQNGSQDSVGIKYGWEIEQPAASQNNELWLEAFDAEYGQYPHFIGIGTNDLTQFTIALGRDVYTKEEDLKVRNYLEGLYDESEFSIIRQIYEVSKQCKKRDVRLFLLGQAAGRQEYAELMLSFGIIPSVGISYVRRVKIIADEFEKRRNSKEEVIRRYVENLCNKEYSSVKNYIKPKLLEMFGV